MHNPRVCPVVALAIVLAVGLVGGAAAQTPSPDQAINGWAPWAGCWTPIDAQSPARDLRVCVVPAADRRGARLMTFAGDRQLNEETIVADDTVRSLQERGCRSERRTRWATSGLRLFSSGEIACDGQAAQPSSAISTLLSRNRWLDVRVTGPAGREVVRTAHYARSTDAPPAAIAEALRDQPPSSATLTVRVSLEDVLEASQAVASPAVETWVAEAEPRLAINRLALRKLSAAKVSEPVIDLLVGLAYPTRFEVRRSSSGGDFSGGPFGVGDPFVVPFGPWDATWDPYSLYASMYSPFGIPYVGAGTYPYGFFGYQYGGWYQNVPVVPMAPGEPAASGTGVAVNGRGYTRVQPRETVARGTADGGGSVFSSTPADGGGSGAGGGSVSPGGYSSGGSGGGGGGNVAVPR